jgi:hypothetical protein
VESVMTVRHAVIRPMESMYGAVHECDWRASFFDPVVMKVTRLFDLRAFVLIGMPRKRPRRLVLRYDAGAFSSTAFGRIGPSALVLRQQYGQCPARCGQFRQINAI